MIGNQLHYGMPGGAPGTFKTFGRGLAFAIEVVIDQNGEPLHVGQHRQHGQLAVDISAQAGTSCAPP